MVFQSCSSVLRVSKITKEKFAVIIRFIYCDVKEIELYGCV